MVTLDFVVLCINKGESEIWRVASNEGLPFKVFVVGNAGVGRVCR